MTVSADFLQEGSTGAEVTRLQENLKKLGVYTGVVDGKFGPATKAAVIKFQKANGLKADGIVGSTTSRTIDIEQYPIGRPTLKQGSTGEQVKILQHLLSSNLLSNAYSGKADGVFGAKTKEAVIKVQKGGNLTPDGIVGQATWKYAYAVASHEWL
jgi:peptidoglycan hydrolase-like protein with peptidoglycan-binding domain